MHGHILESHGCNSPWPLFPGLPETTASLPVLCTAGDWWQKLDGLVARTQQEYANWCVTLLKNVTMSMAQVIPN